MKKIVCKTLKEFEEEVSSLKSIISLDTETNGKPFTELELEEITICDGVKAIYFSFINNIVLKVDSIIQKLINRSELIIMQNCVYDLQVLHKFGIQLDSSKIQLFDTMVAEHLLDEEARVGLKEMAKKYFGVEPLTYEEAKRTGGQTFIDYALNDAIWTYEIAMIQKEKLREEGLVPLFTEIEMPFMWCLLEMAITGITVNKKLADKYTKQLIKAKDETIIEMLNELGIKYEMQFDLFNNMKIISPIKFSSSQQIGDILFKQLQLDVVEYTASGQASVGKTTIEKYKNTVPFVKLLYKFKTIDKLLSSFFEPLPNFIQSDGNIRPVLFDVGTKTGRLSSFKPNMQQLAKVKKDLPELPNLRECFIAPKGYKMIVCDYSGQELRVLTQLTKEPQLIEAFNNNKDLHLTTANEFFDLNIPKEELYTTHPNFKKQKETHYEARNNAKVVNFGIAYGKQAFGFAKDFNITEAEAEVMLSKYFGAYPNVQKAIKDCHDLVIKQGWVQSMSLRKRRFKCNEQGYYPNKAFRQSFNFLIQGFSADMIRKACIKCKELADWNKHIDLKQVLTVHDEVVFIVKEQYAEDTAKKIKRVFEEKVCTFVIPVKADVDIGDNYGEAK